MNRLAVLGLDDLAEQLYRQVLRDQARPASVYAARLNRSAAEIDDARATIAGRLAEIDDAPATIAGRLAETDEVPVERAARWVGVAGTFTTLSALAQGLGEYDAARIHDSVITSRRLREVCAELVADSVEERLALGPMHPGRADVIGGGSLVASALCDLMERRAGIAEVTISEKDILDGIALSIAR